ncbi:MAG: serine/threonine-protein kinase [Planctomycetota bacterium]
MNPTPPASGRPLVGLDPHRLLASASAQAGHPPFSAIAPLFPAYELLETLGAGGAGTVYRARHKRLDREVALKVLHPELAADAGALERFRREARTLARLQHPFLIGLLDFGEVEGVSFLVLEYCRGGTLRRLLTGDADARRDALRVLALVCDAIDYAHARGTVHRDLKPENVLLDERGYPRVADFGLVRLRVADTPPMTVTGDVMGTPHYMAPEQVAGRDADARADVYALGVMIYQALTGTLPVGRFDPPSAHPSPLRRDLDDLVMRALDHDPAVRPTAGELGRKVMVAPPGGSPLTANPDRPRAATPRPAHILDSVPRARAACVAAIVLSLFQLWIDSDWVKASGFDLTPRLLGIRLPIWLAGAFALADLGAHTRARYLGLPPRNRWLAWAAIVSGGALAIMTILVPVGAIALSRAAFEPTMVPGAQLQNGVGPILMLAAVIALLVIELHDRRQQAYALLSAHRRRQRERKRRA